MIGHVVIVVSFVSHDQWRVSHNCSSVDLLLSHSLWSAVVDCSCFNVVVIASAKSLITTP